MNAYFANRYNVMFPNLEFNAKEWERIRRITEIDWDYAPEAMERTKAQLSQSVAIAEPGIIPAITDICASGTGTVGGSYRKKKWRRYKIPATFLLPLNIDMCFLYFFDDRIDLI